MLLSNLAQQLQGQLLGQDQSYNQLCLDSRELETDNLFVALKGDKVDGHDFVPQVSHLQGAGALVEHPVDSDLPQIVVNDTQKALTRLGHWYRQQMQCPVTAITGSCGKTTTRVILSTILNQNHEVLATKRSFNTALGLPVVLSQYQQQQFAVFEAGADQHGELKALSAMLRPDIAVITTIASAHLKGFGSLKGVAQAKSELFTHLSPQGIAVINQDAPYAELCQQLAGDHSIVTFSTQQQADFTAHNLYYDSAFNLRFTLKTPSGQFDALLPLLGKHQAVNALAATACAYYLGLDSDQIQSGLAQVQPEKHRMQRYQGANGSCIIDDSYNANPESTRSALELLSAMPGYRILVIGDMLDLDQHNEVQYHYAVADQAHNLNIDKIYSIGKLASKVTERFPGPSCHYQDLDALTAHLYQVVNANTNVLVKASRGMQLDQIVSKLKQE